MLQTSATTFRWLSSAADAYPQMLAAIDAACVSVRLEMYIFSPQGPGEKFRDTLVNAQKRGVRVRVLIDALGSLFLPAEFWKPLIDAGGEFRWFNPLRMLRLEYRNHRKILVCDERLAFIGGFNIAPEYDGDGVTRGWRDLGWAVEGPLAAVLAEAVDESWERAEFKPRPLERLRRSSARRTAAREGWRLLLGGPGIGYNPLKKTLATDLANAHSVQIVSAYFLPTWRLRHELRRAAARGGRVQLILAGKSDVRLSQLASRRLYQTLLQAGVEINEYQPQILHAKLFILDEQVYVGSANLDPRSLDINYELLVRVADAAQAQRGRELFTEMLRHCRRVELAGWRKSRSIWTKLLERWAFFFLARIDTTWARQHLRNLP